MVGIVFSCLHTLNLKRIHEYKYSCFQVEMLLLQSDNIPFRSVCLIISGSTVSESNGDGTFKLTTTLQIKFNKSDDGRTFRCIVQPQPGRGDKVTKDRRIFVHCEFTQLRYKHTERQASGARSQWNTFAAPIHAPNRPQTHCLNLKLTLTLMLDARCVYTLTAYISMKY